MAVALANGIRVSDGTGAGIFIAPRAPKGRRTRLLRLQAGDTLAVLGAEAGATDAWEIARDTAKERLHPTQKPVRLFEIPILNHTRQGDTVAEPFAGAGGQYLAAHGLGRRCYGMDLDPKYAAVVLERMAGAGVQGRIEAAGNPPGAGGKPRGRARRPA
jgi:hypothetical protein